MVLKSLHNKQYNIYIWLLAIVAPLLYQTIGQGFLILIYPLLITVAICYFNKKEQNIIISTQDIFVATYLIYGLFNILLIKENVIDNLLVFQWLFLISIYILSRGIKGDKTNILYFIVVSGV